MLQVKSFFKESGVDFKAFELDQIGGCLVPPPYCMHLPNP